MRYYSPSTGCTYLQGIHDQDWPADAVPISEERYLSAIANARPGQLRKHDLAGLPYVVDPPEQSESELSKLAAEQRTVRERAWRDQALASAAGLRDRHRDQLDIDVPTTLSAEQFKELLVYMQALRDWPQSPNFPKQEGRPAAPTWITE